MCGHYHYFEQLKWNLIQKIFVRLQTNLISFYIKGSNSIESIKIVKKSFSITINLVLLGVYIVNISFGGLSVLKYTKVFVLRWYHSHQILLDEVFNDYKELV